MPMYTFEILKGKEKGQQFDIEMPWEILEAYELKFKGKLQRVFVMHLGDPIQLGVTKAPSDFQKYVVGRIQSAVPGAQVGHKFKVPKEI